MKNGGKTKVLRLYFVQCMYIYILYIYIYIYIYIAYIYIDR